MKKQLKKALAVVCAVAMVVAGITVVPNSVKADTTGVEAPAEQLKEIGGDAAATWFYDEAKTTGIEKVVNIQKPGFAKESGVYVLVPAGISKDTVNGNDDAALTAIQGAGVVVYLTSLTKEYNTVVITYANGEGTVVIKNVNGTKDTTVPYEISNKYMKLFHKGTKFVSIEDGNHNFDKLSDIKQVLKLTLETVSISNLLIASLFDSQVYII